jgi:hypothetical protein
MRQGNRDQDMKAYLWMGLRTMLAATALLVVYGSATATAAVPGHPFLSAVPGHPFLSALDASQTPPGEFDHACGVAVDSEGDVYVASGGQDAIRIFDSSHAYLGSIAEPNEPCGLAVDSVGRLYVSEHATGKVVIYTPAAFPFSGAPSYGTGTTIDGSGAAEGVAVDPSDDFLYVAESNRIAIFKPNGESGGAIGEGTLSGATGVAVWSRPTGFPRETFVFAAEPTGDKIDVFTRLGEGPFVHRTEIKGSDTPDQSLGLAASGASLGVDSSTGHIFALDAINDLVNEFEATGPLVSQSTATGLADAQPTAIAVDRSGGATEGDLYVTAGPGAGSEVLIFGPLNAPKRSSLGEPPSQTQSEACGVVVDRFGYLYVAGQKVIKVYNPAGALLTSIADPNFPCYLAVDASGILYAVDRGSAISGDEKVVLYKPEMFPLQAGTGYASPKLIEETPQEPKGIAVDPETGQLYVSGESTVSKYGSASEGSALLDSEFGGLHHELRGLDVYGSTHEVYVGLNGSSSIVVFDSNGTEKVRSFSTAHAAGPGVAIDQSNGHVLLATAPSGGSIEEYESSGAFVGSFGSFPQVGVASDVAIDNSNGPGKGRLYVAYRNEVKAFGPLRRGDVPPTVVTGSATEIGDGAATLAGTVNPNGLSPSSCSFQIVTEAQFKVSEFSAATEAPCEPPADALGSGEEPVAVSARVTGLDPDDRYRFRLVAENSAGVDTGSAATFGPPVVTLELPQPIGYGEATLRGTVDAAGLATTYRFEYGPTAAYGSTTASASMPPGTGPVSIEVPVLGLSPGTIYHFRLVAENADQTTRSEDRNFTTLARPAAQTCANDTLRLENSSSNLPDCRAYELVTPADLHGGIPFSGSGVANAWHVAPYGPDAGNRLTFTIEQTLPGTEGSGMSDAFRATRGSGGWTSALYGPSAAEAGIASLPEEHVVSPEQTYSAFHFRPPTGQGFGDSFLRTPSGFEPLGQGTFGVDPQALGNLISPGAEHVIFSTGNSASAPAIPLEPNAPPAGVGAVYDRTPGGATKVVSLLPGNLTPTDRAVFRGATEDGRSVVFSVIHGAQSTLYLRRNDVETVEIATPVTPQESPGFAGISASGNRIFFSRGADLFAFDLEGRTTTEIAPASRFATVSADGSHAYFLSEKRLDDAGDGIPGEPNLYVWNGSAIELVAVLGSMEELGKWIPPNRQTAGCVTEERGSCPLRATPTGNVLVFESRQGLAGAGTGGHSGVYRFQAGAVGADRLRCISCDSGGSPAGGDARLQNLQQGVHAALPTDLIPNVTPGGDRVFFEADDSLLPEDANSATDVYEWKANGTGGCVGGAGCLSLISSGQGEGPSYLYAMTPDGHDVFFVTEEKLISSDIPGSASIYDARVEGGFPAQAESEPCEGDACQGEGSQPPPRPTIRSGAAGSAGVRGHRRCRKGQRRLKGRCVRVHHRKHPRHRRHHHHKRKTGHAGPGRER